MYDLQTELGWIVSGGIVTSNCKCSLREVSIFEARREGLLDEHGHMRTMLPPGFGINARPDHGFGRGRPDRLVATGAIA